MKKKFLWFPIFISLSVTTLFPSCVSVKTVDEILIGGAILAAGGILSLFTKNDDKKQDKVSSNESKQEVKKTQAALNTATQSLRKNLYQNGRNARSIPSDIPSGKSCDLSWMI